MQEVAAFWSMRVILFLIVQQLLKLHCQIKKLNKTVETEIRIAKWYMKIKPKCDIRKLGQIEMNTALHDINLTMSGITNYHM